MAAAVVAAVAVTMYPGYRHLNGNIRVRNIGRLVGTQPVAPHPRAQNILVLGSDSRTGTNGQYGNASVGDGSDLERIGRQQAFMSSPAARARSGLYNPVAMYRFLDAATKSISIDSGLGGIRGLYDLANRLRSMPARNLRFITLPTYPRSLVDPADTANVLWLQPEARGIFVSLRDDAPWTAQPSASTAAHEHVFVAGTGHVGAATPAPPSPSVAIRTGSQNTCT
ncbi:MAG TPA: hypothetical protein VLW50_24650 [Streptosporangiaceae bacterium]|nr:hypothetical protein [Streptosporangiaceae bacterium]